MRRVAAVLLAAALAACGSRGRATLSTAHPSGAASAAVADFFARYVDGDGRVVRRDQGGDTVSEGQAYAMLLAVAVGDRARFERVWGWAAANLQRPDGLLSWRWAEGRVADPSPAADADLDAARALVRAGSRFDAPALGAAGRRVATAVLDHETVTAGGRRVLVAGPWAVDRRVVNPSYVSPCTYAELGEATGDGRWGALAAGDEAVLGGLLATGLPPDWAVVGDDGKARPAASPAGTGEGRYGFDAARVPFRLAEGCGEGPALARRLWVRLAPLDGQGGAMAYALDGRRLVAGEHPVGLVGAAAAAEAAGQGEVARRLLARAADLDRRQPTYYGAAWVAFGRVLLEDGGA
ncbi:MAG TPA: glycosyl hydrolase family 8 [Acidimicrobiales bacterium]|nr:glycosyl hydrolase family 8 [Acidimicrobiales bacterium]